jgi:hypothetical protein
VVCKTSSYSLQRDRDRERDREREEEMRVSLRVSVSLIFVRLVVETWSYGVVPTTMGADE